MRHAVIRHGVRFLRDRYRHFVRDRIDFQRADRDLKGVVFFLRALVYLKGEQVLALANVRLASRKVIRHAFAVSKAVAANRYRFVHQRFAVVDLLIGSGGQLHAALLDFELAIFHNLKPDVREVLALVREALNGQPHLVFARVGAFRDHVYVSAVKLNILIRVIQLVAGLRIKAKDEMQLAVIHHTVRLALDLYRHSIRDRRDFQRAVLRRDSVVVRVRALFRLVGERVSTLANVRLASRKGIVQTFAVRERLFRARHFRYRGVAVLQRGAVVDLCQVGRGQRHRARVDYELAVRHNKLHVREVRIRVLEVLSDPPHGVSARVRSSRSLGVLIPEVWRFAGGWFVQRVADADNIILPSRMLLAVIRHGLRPALDRHNHFVRDRRDFQLAFGLFDCVVVRLRALVQRVGERVIALANVRPASRHVIRRAFAVSKAVAAYRHFAVRQRRAVVDLLIRSRGQRHLALLNHELAVFDHERHLREVRVPVREVRSLQRHVVGARVGALHFRLAVKREVFFRVQLVADVGNRVARYGLLGSVILRGASVLLDRHNHFVRGRRDFQLAFGLFDCVVVRLRALVQRVGERVIALANNRLASRHVICRAFAVSKAVAANRHVRLRQRCAVVNLASAIARQRHHALLDLELAVVHNKLNVREVGALVRKVRSSQPHRVSVRISALHFRSALKLEVGFRVLLVADRHPVAARGLLGSVILLGSRVARDRHRHFVRDRRDCQRTIFSLDIVVVRLRALVQRVGERVITRANVRLSARHVVLRAFAVSKAVSAANRHRVVRQRRAVVDLLIRSRGQRHRALADYELAVSRLRNDILFCRVNRALSSGREDSVIRSSIRSLRANFNRAEISVFRRTGKAGNALLLSIISHRVAVRRQLDVLIIVEVKNVIAIDNRERRFLTRNQRVARNIGVRGHSFAELLSSCCGGFNLFLCSVQIIVYRVVSLHRPHVFIIELYIFYRFVKIYLGVKIRIAFPFCF